MKKVLIILCLLITSACYAGGVGYINYEKVAANYLFAKNSIKEVETKGREIEIYLKTKGSTNKEMIEKIYNMLYEKEVKNYECS